jgi:hypothetical protein
MEEPGYCEAEVGKPSAAMTELTASQPSPTAYRAKIHGTTGPFATIKLWDCFFSVLGRG